MKHTVHTVWGRVPWLAWAGAVLGALAVVTWQAERLERREKVQQQLQEQRQTLASAPGREAHEVPMAEWVQRRSQAREQAEQRQRSWPALVQADAVWLALQGWLTQQGLQVRELRADPEGPAQVLPMGSTWRSVQLSVQGPLAAWRAVWTAWMRSAWGWRVDRMSITPLQGDQVLVQARWSLALRDAEPLPEPVAAAFPVPQLRQQGSAVTARPQQTDLRWVGWWTRGEEREAVLVQGTQWLRVPVGALVGSSGLRLRAASAQTLVLVRENAPKAAPIVMQWTGQEESP